MWENISFRRAAEHDTVPKKQTSMKFSRPLLFSIVLITFLVAAFYPKVNSEEREAVIMSTILRFVKQLHFQPKNIDDDFSESFFQLYLDRVDGGRRFLIQPDVDKLSTYQTQLDEHVLTGKYDFFDRTVELMDQGREKAQGFYREILSEPFDFTREEYFQEDGEKREYCANDAELREYWRQYLKFETMRRLNRKLEEQEELGEEGEKQSFEELEKEARESVLELMDDWFERIEKVKRSARLAGYLNALVNVFDPHTNYYEPIEKENFNIRFSGRLEGIGARLQTEGEYTKVNDIVVGGPAWKEGHLKENDIIMKVAQEDEEAWTDIQGMTINEVVSLIRGDKGTKVRLWVKKVDGTTEEIVITRDVVVIEEGYAKSLILDGVEAGEKIGYLYLPRFYADFQNRDGRFSAKDVEEELEKLQAENVDGVIIDLRNNGGGSLRDVIKMTGLFIEEGPVVQVKARNRRPEVLYDDDPRVQYDGPLIVMVNEFSASASEIMAAALQDYERAVIVGSGGPTFGKGTVQQFHNLDRGVPGYEEIKPLGEIKLTTQKFYRIDGGSTQKRGVQPDIVLPDRYQFITFGEKDEDFALPWTEIDPVPHRQNVRKVSSLNSLRKKSEKRVSNDDTFQKIVENAQRLKNQQEQSEIPLSLTAYQNLYDEREAEAKNYDDIFESVVNQGVKNLEVDLPSIHADESREERNAEFIEEVSKDIHIKETLHIMHDMLN